MKGMLRDGTFVVGGQVASAVAVLASVRILTEYLSPDQYGLMVLLVGSASTVSAVLVWPLGQAILVTHASFAARGAAAEFRREARLSAGAQLSVVFGVLTFSGAILSAFVDIHWSIGLLTGLLFVLEARRYLSMTLLMAAREQRAAAFIFSSDAWLRLAGAWIAVVAFQATAVGAVIGTIVGSGVLSAILYVQGQRDRIGALMPASRLREEIRTTLSSRARPLVLSVVLANVTEMSGRYFVAGAAGLGQAGLFTAATALVRRPFGMLNSVTDWSLKPIAATARAAGDQKRFVQASAGWVVIGTSMSLTGLALLLLFQDQVVQLLLAREFWDVGDLMVWAAVGMVCLNVSNVLNGTSLVMGRARSTVMASLTGAAVTILASAALVEPYGARGIAMAAAIAYLCQLVVSAVLAMHEFARSKRIDRSTES